MAQYVGTSLDQGARGVLPSNNGANSAGSASRVLCPQCRQNFPAILIKPSGKCVSCSVQSRHEQQASVHGGADKQRRQPAPMPIKKVHTAHNPVNSAEVAQAYYSKEQGMNFSDRSSRSSSEPGVKVVAESQNDTSTVSASAGMTKSTPKTVSISDTAPPPAGKPTGATSPNPAAIKASNPALSVANSNYRSSQHGPGNNQSRLPPRQRKQLEEEQRAEEERKQLKEFARLKFNAELDAIEDESRYFKEELRRIVKEEKRQRQLEKQRRKLDKQHERERRRAQRQAERDARQAAEGLAKPAEVYEDGGEEEEAVSDLDEEELKRIEDEKKEAIEAACDKRAKNARFVGDIKIICASGLPKVDTSWFGSGSIDPYIVVKFNGEEISRTAVKKNSMRPRYDHHIKVNFQGSGDELPPPEDAEFVFELWDWDKFSDDDFVSHVILPSLEARQRMCRVDHRPVKFDFQARPEATTKNELKFIQGYLLLQFELAANIDYEAEAAKAEHSTQNVQQILANRIKKARKDFQV